MLRDPVRMRNALRYVLNNGLKHASARRGRRAQPPRLDPCSSARWFEPWRDWWPTVTRPRGASPVASPRSWLLRVGWKRAGPMIHPAEVPG